MFPKTNNYLFFLSFLFAKQRRAKHIHTVCIYSTACMHFFIIGDACTCTLPFFFFSEGKVNLSFSPLLYHSLNNSLIKSYRVPERKANSFLLFSFLLFFFSFFGRALVFIQAGIKPGLFNNLIIILIIIIDFFNTKIILTAILKTKIHRKELKQQSEPSERTYSFTYIHVDIKP